MTKDQEQDKKQYITLDEGVDFRKIAKAMTRQGIRMNHATARNQVIQAMNNLLMNAGKRLGIELSSDKLANLLKKQDIHDSLGDILWTAHKALLAEKNKKETNSQ